MTSLKMMMMMGDRSLVFLIVLAAFAYGLLAYVTVASSQPKFVEWVSPSGVKCVAYVGHNVVCEFPYLVEEMEDE